MKINRKGAKPQSLSCFFSLRPLRRCVSAVKFRDLAVSIRASFFRQPNKRENSSSAKGGVWKLTAKARSRKVPQSLFCFFSLRYAKTLLKSLRPSAPLRLRGKIQRPRFTNQGSRSFVSTPSSKSSSYATSPFAPFSSTKSTLQMPLDTNPRPVIFPAVFLYVWLNTSLPL